MASGSSSLCFSNLDSFGLEYFGGDHFKLSSSKDGPRVFMHLNEIWVTSSGLGNFLLPAMEEENIIKCVLLANSGGPCGVSWW